MALWRELRKRKVVQVAVLYAAVAWALTEVLGFLIDAFPFFPDWANTIVALLFMLGFPVSIFLAWVFDVQPGGGIRTTPGSLWGGIAIAGSAALLVAGTLGLFTLIYPQTDSGPAEAAVEEAAVVNAIAVLPVAVESDSGIDRYLIDGLTDEIITLLTQLDGLNVAARNSAYRFRDRAVPLSDIRRDLRVSHILEGNVRSHGVSVRLALQLVDTRTGYQLWAGSFDQVEDSLQTLPARVARVVVERLGLDRARIAAAEEVDAEAYRLYLKGEQLSRTGRTEPELRESMRLFEAALQLDPAFAPALVGIGQAWITLADQGLAPADSGYATARAAGEKALGMAPELAGAHLLLGWIALYHDWDWDSAERYLRDALLLQPGDSQIMGANASLEQIQGRGERALELAQKVAERDPLRASAHANLAYFAWTLGRPGAAEAAARRALVLDEDFPGVHLTLAQLAMESGNFEVARGQLELEPHPLLKTFGEALLAGSMGDPEAGQAAIDQLIRDYNDAGAYQIAELYAHGNDPDRAFKWLERAYAIRDPGLVQLNVDPLMRNIRTDNRFAGLVGKLQLGGH